MTGMDLARIERVLTEEYHRVLKSRIRLARWFGATPGHDGLLAGLGETLGRVREEQP